MDRLIVTEEIKSFFKKLAFFIARLEDYDRHQRPIKDKKALEEELKIFIRDFSYKFVCQLVIIGGRWHNWCADSSIVWGFDGIAFSKTNAIPNRPYDFVVEYSGNERYGFGILIWIESAEITSPYIGEKGKFILLPDGKLGTTEYTSFPTGLWDLTGNKRIYYPDDGKLNVTSKGFSEICKIREEWLFECVHETFPGRKNKGVRFWEPIELILGIPEVEITSQGVMLSHILSSPNSKIKERAGKVKWAVLERKIWISPLGKLSGGGFFFRLTTEEGEKLTEVISRARVVGTSFYMKDGIGNNVTFALEEETGLSPQEIRVEISPITFHLSSYNSEKNSVTGILSVDKLGLKKEVVDGDFLRFFQHGGDFMLKCGFCEKMAVATVFVEVKSRVFYWDEYSQYRERKNFCSAHEAIAKKSLLSIPKAGTEDFREGTRRLSDELFVVHRG